MDRKIIYLVSTVAVLAVLLVGVGYAYSIYYESTENTAVPSYVTITQTGESYSFTSEDATIPLDRLQRQDGTYYGIAGGTVLNNSVMGSFFCADLGSVGFHAELTGADDYPDLGIEVRSSKNFTATSNWIYFLTDGTKVFAYLDDSSNSWKKGPDTLVITSTGSGAERTYVDTAAHIYYGYSTGNSFSLDGVYYMKNKESPSPLTDASIVFRASDVINHSVSYVVNDGSSAVKYYIDNDTSAAAEDGYAPKELAATGLSLPEGRTFLGWSRTANGDVVEGTIEIDGDIVLFAKYGTAS